MSTHIFRLSPRFAFCTVPPIDGSLDSACSESIGADSKSHLVVIGLHDCDCLPFGIVCFGDYVYAFLFGVRVVKQHGLRVLDQPIVHGHRIGDLRLRDRAIGDDDGAFLGGDFIMGSGPTACRQRGRSYQLISFNLMRWTY